MDINALTNELAEKLGLKEAAQQNALAGMPAQDATGLTGAEIGAVEEAKKAARKALHALDVLCQNAKDSIQNCSETLARGRKQRQVIMASVPPVSKNVLEALDKGINQTSAAYAKFKADNRLQREASGGDRFTQTVWAFFVVIVEGLFNSYFFASASEYGLAGGFFFAFFFSFANVGCAFLGGVLGLRYAGHCDPAKKLAGVLLSLTFVLVCMVVVCLSALYRGHLDLLRGAVLPEKLAFEAWGAALDSLKHLDFWGLIVTPEAFLLMIVGVFCAFIGFWKGYEYDDRYPGFGTMLRQKENARENYKNALNALEKQRSDRNVKLQKVSEDIDRAVNTMNSKFNAFRQEAGGAHLSAQTSQLAESLLVVYRQANSEIRADSAPPYFEQFPDENEFHGLDEESRRLKAECDEIRPEKESLQKECQEEKEQIQRELT
ncbi:MAG: hypothetical protein ACR2P9_02330 [Gammaproteobacteria bacterium]